MLEALKVILDIQELDMKMIRLLRLKKERQRELNKLNATKGNLERQVILKEGEIMELKKDIRLSEGEVNEVVARIKKLEGQQNAVKKVDEFNALTQEISAAEREKTAKEHRLSDLYDKLAVEEETLKGLTESFETAKKDSKAISEEIYEGVAKINEEGRSLKKERDRLKEQADPDVFRIYERLLRNKKDRVVVPIENRCCTGCHIMLTPQDENLVRKGERLVFCEHCSRIHYWQESEVLEGTVVAPKQRRRRSSKATAK